jgi:hypothetical protein
MGHSGEGDDESMVDSARSRGLCGVKLAVLESYA